MKKTILLSIFACASLFAKPLVTTTILPTKYFVEQIAGDSINVEAMVERGADPHTFEPKPSQMKSVEKSDLHFAVGMEFDKVWLPKLQKQFPNLVVVDTDKGVEKVEMSKHHHHHDADHEEHSHDTHKKTSNHEDDEHDHSGLDPHIWLDPILVKTQVENIANALIEKYPQNKTLFELNLAKFKENLDKFDANTAKILKELKTDKFMVYHPSWGYFAKRYGLVQIPIEIEGKEPKPADLKNLINEAKEEGVKVIFVAPQFSQKSASTIAKATSASVVEIDQLPYEWLDEMQKTVDVFAKYLK